MKLSLISFIITILIVSKYTVAQSYSQFIGTQDSLSRLSSGIWKHKADNERLAASDSFYRKFQAILELDSSEVIPFDSIVGITRAVSDDNRVRIFTWNVPMADGTNKYFGLIHLMGSSPKVIPLQSTPTGSSGFENKQFTTQQWYGALYYKIIQVEIRDRIAYTLLGWDGYSISSNRKLIDMLLISMDGNVQFGMPVFKTAQGIKYRVVMEYSKNASMLLRYDYQAIKVQKKRRVKRVPTWIIVMDRLIPMDPSLKGLRKYYVPSGDIHDGYIFRNGYWVLVEDIDVANRK